MSELRTYLERRRQQEAAAWFAHTADPARGTVVAALSDWLTTAVEALPTSIPAHGLGDVAAPDRLGDRLRALALPDRAATLEAFLASENGDGSEASLQAGMAFGEALAHAVASRPKGLARLANWLCGIHDELTYAYAKTLKSRAHTESVVRFALRRLLRTQIETFNRDPRSVALCSSSAPITRWIEARDKGDELRALWDGGLGHNDFRIHDSLHFDLLRRVDPRAFTALLCRFAIPGPAANLLESMAWDEDLSDLAALLARAPRLSIRQGRWIERGALTVLLLATAAGELQKRARCATGDDRKTRSLSAVDALVLEHAVLVITDALLGRPDGPELARLWLHRLFWEDASWNVWELPLLPLPSPSPENCGRTLIGVLVQAIASRLPSLSHPEDDLRATDELQRWPRLLTHLAVSALGSGESGEVSPASLLARLVKADLTETVGLDRLIGSPNRLAASLVRHTVLAEADPVRWFTMLWFSREVALSRERRWTCEDPQSSYDGCNAALLTAAIGLAAATPLGPPSHAQRSLFVAVADAIAGQVLAPTRIDVGAHWQMARRACVALWARMRSATQPDPMALSDLLRPFVRPSETFAWDLIELARAGVATRDITAALRTLGHDLANLLGIIRSDVSRRGERSRITRDESRTLDTLWEEAIAIDG